MPGWTNDLVSCIPSILLIHVKDPHAIPETCDQFSPGSQPHRTFELLKGYLAAYLKIFPACDAHVSTWLGKTPR